MRMGMLAAIAVLGDLFAACGQDVVPPPSLGTRVEYEVFEAAPYPPAPPIETISLTGMGGSCTPNRAMSYTEASALTWAVGTALDVNVFWPDRTHCTGSIFASTCPWTIADIVSLAPAVWDSKIVGTGDTATKVISVFASSAGRGGFRVTVASSTFTPDFVLTSAQPSSLMFERASGPFYRDTISGAVDHVDVPAGRDGAFVVTLRDKDGGHLCGPVRAVLQTDGDPVFSIDRVVGADFANMPYHILAGTTPGTGRILFDAAGLHGVLVVSVQ